MAEHDAIGERIEQLDDDERASLGAAHLEEVERLAGPDGLWLEVETHFAGGRRP